MEEASTQTGASFCFLHTATSRESGMVAMRALSQGLSHGSCAADRSHEQGDQEKQQGDEKHDFRDFHGRECDSTKSQHRRDQRDDQERDNQTEHDVPL